MAAIEDQRAKLSTNSPSDEELIFDFFTLPPELRNIIYSMLLVDREVVSGVTERGEQSIEVTARVRPLLKLLFLARQFKTEYEENARHVQTLLFKDMGGSGLDPPKLKEPLKMSTKAEVWLLACCETPHCSGLYCNASFELEVHAQWIEATLANFERLEAVGIKLHLTSYDDGVDKSAQHTARVLRTVEKLTQLPKVRRVEVFPFVASKEGKRAEVYKLGKVPVCVWTQKDGWQDV